MPIGLQTLIVFAAVAAAAVYVLRVYLPRKNTTSGCGACPANPNRRDDYT